MLCSIKAEILTNYSFHADSILTTYEDMFYTKCESCEFSNKNFATS